MFFVDDTFFSCEKGFYVDKCEEECSDACRLEESPFIKSCYRNGTCDKCDVGYYSNNCLVQCPKNCYQNICNFTSGNYNACIEGYTGLKCTEKCGNCLTSFCKFLDGKCDSCNSTFWEKYVTIL